MSQCLDEAADAMVEMVKGVKNADLKSMGAYSMIHPTKAAELGQDEDSDK